MNTTIQRVTVSAYKVPTDGPESDGTLEWDSTTMVLVEVGAGDATGLGFTYGHPSIALLIQEKLKPLLLKQDPMAIQGTWERLVAALRNLGRPGVSSMAIAAVDIALWDLKARLLGVPLAKLLGPARLGVPAYGSGGFTSYPVARLQEQLGGWAQAGLGSVKMKVGRNPAKDLERVKSAREAVGPSTHLFVDANGAYSRKEALAQAEAFDALRVEWFEEPVVSDDLEGLRLMRERAPAGMVIAAGEYGYEPVYFLRMLQTGAIDVLQADATRCAGITGFMQVGALCEAFMTPLSAHTAPSIHQHPCCALGRAVNVEYFYDHYRIEEMFFEGAARPVEGELRPDLSRPGLGLELKRSNLKAYAV